MHYYLDEQANNALTRRAGQTGKAFVPVGAERSSPLPTLARATVAVTAYTTASFRLLKNLPDNLADGSDTRGAYALCDIAANDTVLLHRCVGEDSGGFWAATKCDAIPVIDTDVHACSLCADGTGPNEWVASFTNLTLDSSVASSTRHQEMRDWMFANTIAMTHSACIWEGFVESADFTPPTDFPDNMSIRVTLDLNTLPGQLQVTLSNTGDLSSYPLSLGLTTSTKFDCESSHTLDLPHNTSSFDWFTDPITVTIRPA